MPDFDLAIIGGGINGAAIARDAAGRGLRVALIEQGDLASGTSSASTKLIHGGLRYLEQGAFRLVREGLQERARLARLAPHIIWPARFVLPHHAGLRPAWQLRLGLFLYDLLGKTGAFLPTRRLNLQKEETGTPLRARYTTGFEYSDAIVDDARFVILNALDASERGAEIFTRTKFIHATRQNGEWHILVQKGAEQKNITARGMVNAAGPWIEKVNEQMPLDITRHKIRRVKGSHIVVKRLFTHDKAYIFQNTDGRIVFAIPYQDDFTLIGTTESQFRGDAADAKASDEDVNYLCHVASDYFRQTISPKDVVWRFAGVRALCDARGISAKDLSRDYVLQLDSDHGVAPLLSVYGGKLTAARVLAERAVEKLKSFFTIGASWTGNAPLPGGDFSDFPALVLDIRARFPFLPEGLAARMARAYGTRVERVLEGAKSIEDLGLCFGADFSEMELRYLRQHEWAQTAEDVLWRRTKLGLRFSEDEQLNLQRFMERA